ncbi:MAG TPA: SGNH/GDSL hydrolase family protein [Candidatus Limnocylindrales bacterium]|nr:SGNH/GDSL hydrolase family protein [Candidatus Limnocylindrales bacterium]
MNASFTSCKKLCWPLLLALLVSNAATSADFLIHDGDRVVFLGDSITEQRLYTTYIEAYALTRHPEWKLTFRNVGWGGDTSWLRQRAHPDEAKLFAADEANQQQMVEDSVRRGLKRDVLPLKPTFVTVKFGMNDHSYQPFREDIFKAYVRSQKQIAEDLKANGARVAFLTPQPIEDKRPDPDKDARNQSLRKFSDGLREVAEKEGAAFVDQFDPYMTMLLRERTGNPDRMVGGGDAVHPGPIGHTVMAWAVLKGLGASPMVSRVVLDCTAKKVAAAEGCRVENLKIDSANISFDRLDEALPMPIDERAEPALSLAPIMDDLDRYELQVSGLPTRSYTITIDGEKAARVTSEELAKACNLANRAGPITKQARDVLAQVFQKNNLFFDRWRSVQLFAFPQWAQSAEVEAKRSTELSRLDQGIAEAEGRIDALRKPKSHHFEIKPAE